MSGLLAGRYRLERELGRGGMGAVHLAHDTLLERNVAVKLLPPDAERDTQARARFRREALAAAALDHPFICKIHEVGEDQGRSFIVMEYVEGRTLDAVARDGVSPRELVDIAHEIAQALDEAHRRGIIHRDLKPSNIMLTVQGHVKVLDFGLAKRVTRERGDETQAEGLTDSGTRLGTPAYMSPEQVLGSPLDLRSDVFSLGAILHELAGGRHPFMKSNTGDTMAAILRDPPSSTEADLDVVPGFGRIVHRMLAKACAERFQTMSEAKALLDEVRRGGSGITPPSGISGRLPMPEERTPFVSRDQELAELTAAIDRMLLGEGGLVLLGGEPGVGKTRLAREVQRIAHARGCLILTGQCYEQEGAPPFGPFIEMVEYAVRKLPQASRAALGESAGEIASIVPSLRRTYQDIPLAAVVPADQQRRLIFNAYLEYTQRGTQKSALVVLFDDLHWADESSLHLLLHVAPHLRTMRMLAIGTYRDVELDTARPFAKALETLLRQRLATRISVKRLNAAGVEQMLKTMSGSPPPSSLVKVVYQETDGNPFFVEEVYQHLAEEGKIFGADGRWKADLRVDQIDVPEGVRLVVSRRLERLGDNARKVLAAAAVIGRSFPLDLLLAVAGEAEDEVLDIVEDAERAQLLVSERSRQARYSFVHELIRSTLVSAVSLPRRQRLHARVADAIERLRAGAIDAHTSVLAHHLYQVGAAVDADRATRVLLKALTGAQAAGAFEEVITVAEQLRTLDLPSGSEELATVDETTAAAYNGLLRPDDAVAPARRAFDTWIARHNDAGIERVATWLAHSYVWGSVGIQAGAAVLERALQSLSPAALRERAVLETTYGTWSVNLGRQDAIALGETAIRSAEALDDPVVIGTAYSMQSDTLRAVGRVAEALGAAERACQYLKGRRSWAECDALWSRLATLYYAGRLEAMDDSLAETFALAERIGHTGALWVCRRMAASRDLIVTGNLEAFRDNALEELTRADMKHWKFISDCQSAGAMLCLGDADSAVKQLETSTGSEFSTFVGLPAILQLGVHAWSGNHTRAAAVWPEAERHLPKQGRTNGLGAWLGLGVAAPALALLDMRAALAALHPAAESFVASGHVVDATSLGVNTSHLTAALAAEAAGLTDRAAGHFDRARAVAERLSSPILRATVDLWHGRHLTTPAEPEARARGAAMLRAAAQGFAALKMPFHERAARRWMDS